MIRLCAFADEYGNSFEEQVEGLKTNGIDLIELRNIDGKNVADLTVEEAEDYYIRFKKEGISVWALGSPIGKVDISVDFDEYLRKFEHVLKVANAFRTDKIRGFSFFNAYEKGDLVFKYLQKMVDLAKEYSVEFYHENEKEIYGDTVERVLEIYSKVKGIKIIYDPANYVQVGETSQEALNEVFKITDYFHVKDVIRETEELVPAGYGDGRIGELLEKINGNFTFTLEPHLALFSGYAQIDNTEMKNKFKFNSNRDAFNFAVKTFKELLSLKEYVKIGSNRYEKR